MTAHIAPDATTAGTPVDGERVSPASPSHARRKVAGDLLATLYLRYPWPVRSRRERRRCERGRMLWMSVLAHAAVAAEDHTAWCDGFGVARKRSEDRRLRCRLVVPDARLRAAAREIQAVPW